MSVADNQQQTIKAKRFSSNDGLDNVVAIDEGNDVITWYRENRAADKFTVRKEVFEGVTKNYKFDKEVNVVNPNPPTTPVVTGEQSTEAAVATASGVESSTAKPKTD